MGELTLQPHLGAGLRQRLTDGKLSNTMQAGVNGFAVVESEQERTSFTASVSLGVSGEAFSASLGYMGEYSADTRETSIYGRMGYRF
ncbi:hypothetical protein [Pseudovibrio sp. SCP19]|uniref:hypothetical protein n=1 Tax=Pseudovibrio sp. SCP19 TaxID=3141374 RepID=UPI00333A251A